ADFRFLRVILVDYLDGQSTHLSTEMVERQLERVAHIVANHSGWPAEGRHKSNLDRFILCRRRTRCEQQRGAHGQKRFTHVFLPEARFGLCSGWPNVPKSAGIGPPGEGAVGRLNRASRALRPVPVDPAASGLAV